MIEVVLYQGFSKRPNSTLRPSGGTTYSCDILEPCNVLTPTITLNAAENPIKYNYAYIGDFDGRYYYIRDGWTFSGGLWVATLACDSLATWAGSIKSSRAYVLRSASKWDGTIVDNMYPATTDTKHVEILGDNPFTANIKDGCYIVGIINSDELAVGSVAYYSFTQTEFRRFANLLAGNIDWAFSNIDDMSKDLFKAMFNPFQYIVSCNWFPFKVSGQDVTKLYYGWWSMEVSCKRIVSTHETKWCELSVPKHPQSSRGVYLNFAPYSRYMLFWSCLGQIPLPPDLLGNADKIHVSVKSDLISGSGFVTIVTMKSGSAQQIVYKGECTIGVSIQLAQITQNDVMGMASNALASAGNFLTGNITGAVSSIGDAINSALPQVSTSGGNGGTACFQDSPILQATFFNVVDDYPVDRGYPYCKDDKLGTFNGFIMCADANFPLPCTRAELEEIHNYCNNGVFIE